MIRRAAAADLPAVRDCAARAYGRYVAAIGRKPAPMVADFAAQIAAGEVHVDVGEDGGLRGFVVFRPEGEAMLLENVAVLPAAAGRGIGRALIRFCEAEALARGLATVRLYTNEKMTENLLSTRGSATPKSRGGGRTASTGCSSRSGCRGRGDGRARHGAPRRPDLCCTREMTSGRAP